MESEPSVGGGGTCSHGNAPASALSTGSDGIGAGQLPATIMAVHRRDSIDAGGITDEYGGNTGGNAGRNAQCYRRHRHRLGSRGIGSRTTGLWIP